MKKLLVCCLALVMLFALSLPLNALASDLRQLDDAEAAPSAPIEPVPYSADASEPQGAPLCPCGPDCPAGADCTCGMCAGSAENGGDYESYHPYGGENLWESWGFDTAEDFVDFFVEIVLMYEYEYLPPDMPFWKVYSGWYDSLDEFLIRENLSMEEYLQLEAAWSKYRERLSQRLVEELVELGGTAGITNVMINGEFIKFGSAVPELIDGVTYVPARPFFEKLGAAVSFNSADSSVTAVFDDYAIRLDMGEEIMLLTDENGEENLHIDHAPYIKDGASYIPIRTVAHDLGLDVLWDSTYKTVVIIDAAALIDMINEDFSIINRMYAVQTASSSDAAAGEAAGGAEGGDAEGISGAGSGGAGSGSVGSGAGGSGEETTITVQASMTEFDSLDGDMTAEFGAEIVSATDGRNYNVNANVDLSALMDIMIADAMEVADYYYEIYGDEYTPYDDEYFELLESIRLIDAEIILNYEKDTLYIKSPTLGALLPDLAEDAWVSIGGINAYLDMLSFGDVLSEVKYEMGFSETLNGPTMGDAIVSQYMYPSYSYYSIYSSYSYYSMYSNRNPIFFFDHITNLTAYYKVLYGDDMFEEDGGVYTLSLSLADILAAAKEFGYRAGYSVYDYDLVITTEGGVTTNVYSKTVYRTGYSIYYQTQYTREYELSPGSTHYFFETHYKNESVMRVDIDMKTVPASEPIILAPPTGEVVVPIEDLLPDDYDYYMYNPLTPLALQP